MIRACIVILTLGLAACAPGYWSWNGSQWVYLPAYGYNQYAQPASTPDYGPPPLSYSQPASTYAQPPAQPGAGEGKWMWDGSKWLWMPDQWW